MMGKIIYLPPIATIQFLKKKRLAVNSIVRVKNKLLCDVCCVSFNSLSHLSLKYSNAFFEVIFERRGLESIKNDKPIIVIFQLCTAEAFFAQTAECVTRLLTFCRNHEFGQ